jgi:hypothetical protein
MSLLTMGYYVTLAKHLTYNDAYVTYRPMMVESLARLYSST